MDERRFDGIARVWSRDLGRRGVIRSLAAVLLVSWGTDRARHAARAQDSLIAHCASNADCRASVADACVRAHCWRGRCAFAAIRCAAGFHCCGNGRCCEDEPEPVPGCASDADCGATNDPCVQSRCEDRLCGSLVVDCAPGFTCCGNAECCPTP
jgi:hypothetical protein